MQTKMLALLALGCATSFSVLADSITVGVNAVENLYPFGYASAGNPGTRYQQAYASSLFGGPMSIDGIDFFLSYPGTLYSAIYTLSFSTIVSNVNSLSDSDFTSNLGHDNTVFDVVTIAPGTAAPNELTFTGTPFTYNPAKGNLLLDIQFTNPSNGTASFESIAATGPSTISRYHDFGYGTLGFGLVTEFDFTPAAAPEPGTLTMLGVGLAGLAAWQSRRSKRSPKQRLRP